MDQCYSLFFLIFLSDLIPVAHSNFGIYLVTNDILIISFERWCDDNDNFWRLKYLNQCYSLFFLFFWLIWYRWHTQIMAFILWLMIYLSSLLNDSAMTIIIFEDQDTWINAVLYFFWLFYWFDTGNNVGIYIIITFLYRINGILLADPTAHSNMMERTPIITH